MKNRQQALILGLVLLTGQAGAGDLTIDAAIGGAVGGAIGGAVGAELGGREGAIVGAGVGAAAGTAINTREHAQGHPVDAPGAGYHAPSQGRFCPPGQAKKGRC